MAQTKQPDFGTFRKDGKTRVASSQAEAVLRRYQGWEEVKPPSKEAAAQVEEAAAGKTDRK